MNSINLNSNISSLIAQRRFTEVTIELGQSFTRLSSGLRINRASDDAAGLAIASSLTVDRRIATQGVRNLNDGISLLNIAEGGMGELTNIVTRIQELAEQGANGTLSDDQRAAMQKEVTELESEWNRLVESTSFNELKLLTGSDTRAVLQGGQGSNGSLVVQIGEAQLAGGIEGFAGGTTRVSTDSSGNQVTGGSSTLGAVSANGRYLAFYSSATDIVAGDTNGITDCFLKDIVTGTTTRVNTDSSGNQATGGTSYTRGISADGRYVVFDSAATNLVAGDTNGQRDGFIKDTLTGTITRISTDSSGNQATGGVSSVEGISADGRYVAFWSLATNLVAGDTNGQRDSFIKDTVTGITTRINTDSSGNQATGGASSVYEISADGRYAVFISAATNLVAGDTNGLADIFMKDTVTGVTTRVNTDSSGNQATGGTSLGCTISPDGRYVMFDSNATNLVAGDTNGLTDTFVKDTVTGVTTRVNTDSSGNQATGGSSGSAQLCAISADGRYVAFNSGATNLVIGDTNGFSDSFIKDTLTGTTTRINTDSSGNQSTGGGGALKAISADGRYAFFESSASNLVSGDTNAVTDIFMKDLTRTGVQQISGMVVSNKVSARITLDLARSYLDELSGHKAGVGAAISRISSFVSNLESQSLNYESAASQILNVDVAEESARITSRSIRQQATSAVLSQANQQPQLALTLLGSI